MEPNQSFRPRTKEILVIFLFYFCFSYLYNVVLCYNMSAQEGFDGSYFELKDYWYRSGMQYVFFFIASVVIWFFCIYLLRKKKKIFQIVLVILVTPFVIYVTRELRYNVVDGMGLGRLRGTGEIWDWYIPLLFFYIQFGCFFAYQYFKEYQRKLKLEAALRQATLKSELAAIKAQLNPHFLYNVFNTINASVPSEQENTRRLIAKLSDLFRYQLKASEKEMVPLGEELEFVENYLDLEKERFGDRLTVTIDVDASLYDEKIPPMVLQPLVENSVKHGLSSLVEGGAVTISIKKQAETLYFEISDTGVGANDYDALFNKGLGLTNTKLRLEKMFQSKLEIGANHPKGLVVKFSI